ncbi:MAG TPA: excinuclease ABC subunit C, partial [Candidatus Parcubacteria bacterium]|nr:excinuclease ABC subunit C [Candidatus Parcubacteria bacterium]
MRIKWLKKENISQLPKTAGVYFFKRGREILYIGKAGNLKKRAKSHFENKGPKDAFLIKDTEKVGFLKTDSEIEALVLEAKLIKKYRPRHNVVWRDDKNYFFLAKTKEDFPLIFITHQPKKNERIEYVGPFVDGRALKQSLKALRKIFPYRSCKRIPKRPCLWHQLQRCPA